MRLVLEIKHEQDLKILLPLLERLKIKVSELPSMMKLRKGKDDKPESGKKNYDPDHLASLFEQLKGLNAFSEISDPVAWQKQLRDEWD